MTRAVARHQVDHGLVAACLIAAGYFVARCHRHHHWLASRNIRL